MKGGHHHRGCACQHLFRKVLAKCGCCYARVRGLSPAIVVEFPMGLSILDQGKTEEIHLFLLQQNFYQYTIRTPWEEIQSLKEGLSQRSPLTQRPTSAQGSSHRSSVTELEHVDSSQAAQCQAQNGGDTNTGVGSGWTAHAPDRVTALKQQELGETGPTVPSSEKPRVATSRYIILSHHTRARCRPALVGAGLRTTGSSNRDPARGFFGDLGENSGKTFLEQGLESYSVAGSDGSLSASVASMQPQASGGSAPSSPGSRRSVSTLKKWLTNPVRKLSAGGGSKGERQVRRLDGRLQGQGPSGRQGEPENILPPSGKELEWRDGPGERRGSSQPGTPTTHRYLSELLQGESSPGHTQDPFPANPLQVTVGSAQDDDTSSQSSVTEDSEEERKSALEKSMYVLKELIETEKLYVSDLGLIVEGYMATMNTRGVPEDMKGKDKIVFGNIHQIFDWHKDYFLGELEKCVADPDRLAELFIKHERRLHMYVVYCQNKPKSEHIVSEYIDTYFERVCVLVCVHDQVSELLCLPLQDFFKYYTKAGMDTTQLEKAVEVMCFVPKRCNDMMNVGRLQGFEGKITAQGKLLQQDTFSVMEQDSGFLSRAKERRVFLFEQLIIFSEPIDRKKGFSLPGYIFKNSIKVSCLGVEDCVDGDPCRFALTSRGADGNTVRFVLQAATPEIHQAWVSDVGQILETQRNFLNDPTVMDPQKAALQSPIEYQRRESKSNSLGRAMRAPLPTSATLRPHSSASIDRHRLPSLSAYNSSLPALYLPSHATQESPQVQHTPPDSNPSPLGLSPMHDHLAFPEQPRLPSAPDQCQGVSNGLCPPAQHSTQTARKPALIKQILIGLGLWLFPTRPGQGGGFVLARAGLTVNRRFLGPSLEGPAQGLSALLCEEDETAALAQKGEEGGGTRPPASDPSILLPAFGCERHDRKLIGQQQESQAIAAAVSEESGLLPAHSGALGTAVALPLTAGRTCWGAGLVLVWNGTVLLHCTTRGPQGTLEVLADSVLGTGASKTPACCGCLVRGESCPLNVRPGITLDPTPAPEGPGMRPVLFPPPPQRVAPSHDLMLSAPCECRPEPGRQPAPQLPPPPGSPRSPAPRGQLHSLAAGEGTRIVFSRVALRNIQSLPPGTDRAASSARVKVTMSASVAVYRSVYTEDQFRQSFGSDGPPSASPRLSERIARGCRCSRAACLRLLRARVPIVSWLPRYRLKKWILGDAVAGLTVGILHIPQGMAFALLTSVAPIYGLYTSFFPVVLYMLFGTGRHVSTGTFAVVSLMTGSVVEQLVPRPLDFNSSSPEAAEIEAQRIGVASAVAFLSGIMMICMFGLQLGFLSTYLSEPIVKAFTSGAAFHVTVSQLQSMLGLRLPRHTGPFSLFKTLAAVFEGLPSTNLAELLISLVCLFVLVPVKEVNTHFRHRLRTPIPVEILTTLAAVFEGLPSTNLAELLISLVCLFVLVPVKEVNTHFRHRLRTPIPVEILTVIIATGVTYASSLDSRYGVQIVGHIPAGFPRPRVPALETLPVVAGDTVAITFVGYAVSMSLAMIYADKHGYSIHPNQELLAHGISNTVSSLFTCFPSSATLATTNILESAGGYTQLSGLFTSLVVLIVLLLIGPLFYFLPKAVLACINVTSLRQMFLQFQDLPELWRVSKIDFAVWLVTWLSVVVLNVDLGLAIGVVFSMMTVICRTQRTDCFVLGRASNTEIYRPIEQHSKCYEVPGVKILSYNGPIYYGNRSFFREAMSHLLGLTPERIRRREKARKALEKREKNAIATVERGVANTSFSSENELFSSEVTEGDVQAVLIDCSSVVFVDVAGARLFIQMCIECQKAGVRIYLATCNESVLKILTASGLMSYMNPQHIFVTVHDAVVYIQQQKVLSSDQRRVTTAQLSVLSLCHHFGFGLGWGL
ncbi:ARHGP factor, partial [Atractosteus spatula]|nr:ARHGP factor [Atractosteus spatula]